MAEKKAEVPEDRCGFELQPDDVGFSGSRSWWVEETNPVCCWRPVWESLDETERCIWHADIDEKSLDALLNGRADGPECLDGAILRGITADEERLSLRGCGLIGATFDSARLPQGDFSDTNLRKAVFSDANLRRATFDDANLREATFSDAELGEAEFPYTDLSKAEFPNAELGVATFTYANLFSAEFPDAFLEDAEFHNAILSYAEFPNAILWQAEFIDANLYHATFSDADATDASFRHANCHDAMFTRTDCRGATFTSALLYETVFADTRINSRTTFFDPASTFYESITSRPGCVYEENALTAEQLDDGERMNLFVGRLPNDVLPLEAARWVYRRLETLHEDNALSEAARQFHISKEEAERALYWDQRKYRPWGVKTLMWHLTKHGESVKHVLRWWGLVILLGGLLFSGLGGVKNSNGTHYVITSLAELGTSAGLVDLFWNLYFSATTFSTIMDGGLAPVGSWTRIVVALESLTGALLVAFLVFVLGRRVAR